MPYRLLDTFRSLFEGQAYLHRRSHLGNLVALELVEDLFHLGKSNKLKERVESGDWTANLRNTAVGKPSRRGDGTFGERVPAASAIIAIGFAVKRAPVATVEVGVETKVLAKAMIKQIDRVITDLKNQVDQFKKSGSKPISVAIVGVNCAERYVSFEGARKYRTDGAKYKHPYQESVQAVSRLIQLAAPHFDEFLILRFRATNEKPFAFEWVNQTEAESQYSALLTRVSRLYDDRFA
jgi:hypothetical protein